MQLFSIFFRPMFSYVLAILFFPRNIARRPPRFFPSPNRRFRFVVDGGELIGGMGFEFLSKLI
jgi:hypothetical protein